MDSTIIKIFVPIAIITIAIFIALKPIVKSFPNLIIRLELIGYILLAISLIWFFIPDSLSSMSYKSDLLIIDEKINSLRNFNTDLYRYIEDGDILKLKESYSRDVEHLHKLMMDSEGIQKQENTARNINGALIGLSSLLIAMGRIRELFLKLEEKE